MIGLKRAIDHTELAIIIGEVIANAHQPLFSEGIRIKLHREAYNRGTEWPLKARFQVVTHPGTKEVKNFPLHTRSAKS